MSRPSIEEVKLLKEFRQRLDGVLKRKEQQTDHFLLRWLRARDLKLDLAEAMLRNSLKWREENGVDNVLTQTIDPWIKANYPFSVAGRDVEGRPVLEMPIGSWDLRKAVEKGLENELITFINYFLETICQSLRDSNEGLKGGQYPISQMILIVDWHNYSYRQLMHWKALQNLLKIASTYEAHYPEIMFRIFFINCPSIFPVVMGMLKPILAAATLGKISCHSNRAEWEPLIQKMVRKEELSPSLGGTRQL